MTICLRCNLVLLRICLFTEQNLSKTNHSNVFSLLVSKAFVKVLFKTPNYQQRKLMRLFNEQKRCNQPETDYSRIIFWCVKLPSLHQWHHLASLKTHSHSIILISRKPWKIDKTLLIHNQLYVYRWNTVETGHVPTPKTYQPHNRTNVWPQKLINCNPFILIIGNSKVHRMGKRLDSNKSLIVKSNKCDQREGRGEKDTRNQWHEEKYAIEQGSWQAFAKIVETKIEDDVNGWQTDKMWKKENHKQIGVIYILYNLFLLIKGRMLPSGRTHFLTPPHNSVKWAAIFTVLSFVTDLSDSCAARNLWAFI